MVADETFTHRAATDTRAADYKRKVDVFLVRLELPVAKSMLAEVRPVVRVEDELGVVHLVVPAENV